MSLYQKASLVQIPSGYKAADDKLYSVVPSNGNGDFTIDSDADATRVNKDGLIESVVADQARLNYDFTNPQDPHLLLEPTRTNNILQSNDPSGANWTDPLSRWTLLTDTTTAPDGGTVRIIELTESGGSLIRLTGFSIAAETYTVSFYIKDIDGNLTGGSVDVGDEGSGAPSPAFGDVGSDWVRATRTITTTGTKSHMDLQPTFSGSTNKVAIWGVQLEAGSYATSLIPTSGSAVTRTADTCKLENFANMPTDYPFTVYSNNNVDLINSNQWAWSILDISSAVKYLGFAFTNSGFIQIHRRNSSNDVDSITTPVTQGQNFKFAITFISNTSYKYSINGGTTVTVTGASDVDFDFNDFLIGQQRVSADTGNRNQCSEFMLFNEALTDAELKTLTS